MKTSRRAIWALLAVLALLASSGCAVLGGAAAGAVGYKYVQGSFETDYRHPYDQVYDATLTSLKDMNMAVGKTERDAVGAKIEASRADGTPVAIELKKAGPQTTDAKIRVGRLGDEDASRVIANNIASKLGETQRQPTGRGGR